MKVIGKILLAVLLMLVSMMQSFAASSLDFKGESQEWAKKELGMRTKINPLDTNQVSVSFEFVPTGELASFNYVKLIIYSDFYDTSTATGQLGRLLTTAVLQPSVRSKEKVQVYFWIDPAYLKRTEIEVVLFNDRDPHYHEHPSEGVDGHGYLISVR